MNLTDILQTSALVVTIVALVATQWVGRKNSNANAFNIIGGTYDRIVAFRLQYPEILNLADDWRQGDISKVGTENEAINKYYSYGGLCVGFVTACLYYSEARVISKRYMTDYFGGLMDLVAQENMNFFADVACKPYCAEAFRAWFKKWQSEHPQAVAATALDEAFVDA